MIKFLLVTTYDPPWTTDWLSEEAKKKLQDYGIAPPEQKTTDKNALLVDDRKSVTCPQCKSTNSKMISQFGSTACKSLYQCNELYGAISTILNVFNLKVLQRTLYITF